MNKISILIIVFFFFNNCSLNENSKIWKDKNKDIDFINQDNIKKLFVKDEIIKKEFNPELSINITKISNISKTTINRNDYGSQNYNGFLEKEVFFSCKVLRLGKAKTHTRIRYEGKLPVDYLSLRELEFFTCARLPVFLSFYRSGISGEKSCFLERCS